MTAKEQQLTELLILSSRSVTHLTAAITAMSFDLLRSTEPSTHAAGLRMIARMEAVSKDLDQQWQLIGELTGVQPPERVDAVEEIQLHSVPRSND
jgi:hypothetical protein